MAGLKFIPQFPSRHELEKKKKHVGIRKGEAQRYVSRLRVWVQPLTRTLLTDKEIGSLNQSRFTLNVKGLRRAAPPRDTPGKASR